MITNVIYEECGSHWSDQLSAVVTTQWLQCDQTLSLSVKGVACESMQGPGHSWSQCQNAGVTNQIYSLWFSGSYYQIAWCVS